VRLESRRLDHETLNLFVVRAFERERLQRLHVDLRQQRVVHVRNWFQKAVEAVSRELFFRRRISPPNFIRGARRHPRKEQRVSAKYEIIGVQFGSATARRLTRFRTYTRAENWSAAVIFRCEQQPS